MKRAANAAAEVAAAAVVLLAFGDASAQGTAVPEAAMRSDAVRMTDLIATMARKTGKAFVMDARVQGDAVVSGRSLADVDYAGFLTILQAGGFTAVQDGDYVRVVPDHVARQLPTPIASGKQTYPAAQYVTRLIDVKHMPATMLVPMLRPLLPQQAHMVASMCSNTLLIVDSYANVRRIEALVTALDTGDPYFPEKCAAPAVDGGRNGS